MAWNDQLKKNWASMPSGTKLQTGLGAGQLLFGALMDNGKRPKMPIPGAVQEATDIARTQAYQTVRPGNEYAISQINRNKGQSIQALNRSLGSGSQILAGVTQIDQNANRALSENAAQNTLFRFNATKNLQESLARLGGYQQKQFEVNEMQPYLTSQQTKNMLVGAGIQNLSGAANTRDEMALYEKVFGSDTGGGAKFFNANPGTPGFFDKPLFRMPQARKNLFMTTYGGNGSGTPQFDENFNFQPQFRF